MPSTLCVVFSNADDVVDCQDSFRDERDAFYDAYDWTSSYPSSLSTMIDACVWNVNDVMIRLDLKKR